MDYVAAVSNGLGYCLAVEKLLNVEAPPRAQAIRVILTELNRIASHLLWLGTHALDIGAITPLFYYDARARIDAEHLREVLRRAAHDARVPHRRTAVRDLRRIREGCARRSATCSCRRWTSTKNCSSGTASGCERMINVGMLNAADCKAYGVTGPMLRAAGVKWDLRKAQPYSGYEKYDFEIPTRENGDTYDRYIVRMQEMRQSVRIIRQAVADIPDRADHGQGAEGDQAAGGRGLRFDRSAEGRAGILHRERRNDAAVSRARAAAVVRQPAVAGQDGARERWWPTWWRSSARSISCWERWTGRMRNARFAKIFLRRSAGGTVGDVPQPEPEARS